MEQKSENNSIKDRMANDNSNLTNYINIINESENEVHNLKNKYLTKKTTKRTENKEKKIFNISHINIDSFFIFDLKNPYKYFNKIIDKNTIKLNEKEYQILKETIYNFQKSIQQNECDKKLIELDEETSSAINHFFKFERKKSKLELYIEERIKENKSRDKISRRKLAKLYSEETGEKVSKTYVNKILKNKLSLSYLKSTVKTSKINNDSGIIASFFFIKAISKCINLGFEILFLDESAIFSTNNNYRCWRKSGEDIYFKLGAKNKRNLLLVVSSNEIIHFKINEKNTDEENFLIFMKEVVEILSKKVNKKFVIVMDNLSAHRTKHLMDFYIENRINIIFNVVYHSNFNAIELAFRAIKFRIYKKLYESIECVVEDIKNMILERTFCITLKKNFIETLNEYLNFYDNNKYINLNNFNN